MSIQCLLELFWFQYDTFALLISEKKNPHNKELKYLNNIYYRQLWLLIVVTTAVTIVQYCSYKVKSNKDVGPNIKCNYFTNTFMIQFHVDKYQTGTPLIYLHKNHILEFNKKNGKQKFIEFNVNKSMKHSVLSTSFVHVV